MSMYEVRDKDEVWQLVREALANLGREDVTMYHHGVAMDEGSGQQVVYFDLPKISILQFNIYVAPEITSRGELLARIRAEIKKRLEMVEQFKAIDITNLI